MKLFSTLLVCSAFISCSCFALSTDIQQSSNVKDAKTVESKIDSGQSNVVQDKAKIDSEETVTIKDTSSVSKDGIESEKKSDEKTTDSMKIDNDIIDINSRISGIYPMSVVATPYVGTLDIRNEMDLIACDNKINEDNTLLHNRSNIDKHMKQTGIEQSMSPMIDISGQLTGGAYYFLDYVGKPKTNIYFDTANLNTVIEVNKWSTGYMAFSYNNGGNPESPSFNKNSGLYLDRGFITFGNLNRSPVYVTVGQIYVPFGNYYSTSIPETLTQLLGRTKERALVIGLDSYKYASYRGLGGFNVSVYGFRGDTYKNNYGINFKYKTDLVTYCFSKNRTTSFDIGVGYLNNMYDSQYIVSNFSGYGKSINQVMNAMDGYISILCNPFFFNAEVVTSVNTSNISDISYLGHSIRPSACDVNIGYNFNILNKSCSISIGSGSTIQAEVLNLPRYRRYAVLSIIPVRYTRVSLGYTRDTKYASLVPTGQKNHANIVNLEGSVYF